MTWMVTLAKVSQEARTAPLTWFPITLDGKPTAEARCEAGHTAYLDDHAIAADGIVTPSLVCPYPGCTWHEHVQLDGWSI